ncbi:phage major capsid protein [Rhodococcoides yunnanense]|uniref:phage major capsid protein n=1 Tax=Rhodococcoides yunnanense TaxID=278209 RepID=UPI00093406FE|nr:phage major capsid protein [Rhodococcus yunnanensis]
MNITELKATISESRSQLEDIATRGEEITGEDADEFDSIEAHVRDAQTRLDQLESRNRAVIDSIASGRTTTEQPQGTEDRAAAANPLKGALTLTRGQSLADYNRANGYTDANAPAPSFDKYVRGLVTGDWKDATLERALSEGSSTAGGHLVPLPVAAGVIELARNQSRVIEAGATTVPMTSNSLKIPRVTGDPGPAWRAENGPVVTNDLSFDAVTLTAKSLSRLIILSRELFYDTEVSDIIAQAFAASFASELDRAALRGTGTAPEPRGILNTSGVTVTNHGTNGTAVGYDFLLDAAGTVAAYNYTPNAHIVAPRSVTALSKAKDDQHNYLTPPAGLLPILPTNQVPTNLTVGTSNLASEVYTGQWNALAIGIRQNFEIEFLREKYADNGQVAFVAHLRADVAVLQPKAFAVDLGIN